MLTLTPLKSFRQWLNNIRVTQNEMGELPGIVPTYKWGYNAGPCWDAVIVNLPYYAWLYTGDTEILKENSKAILRFLENLYSAVEGFTDDHFLRHKGLTDWCPASRPFDMATTPMEFSLLCNNMETAMKAMEIYDALGVRFLAHKNFAKELYDRSKAVARKYFIDPRKCTAAGGTITAQAYALSVGIFETSETDKAFQVLVKLIEKQNNRFDIGTLGIRVLFHVLSDYGRSDLAYDLITGVDHPSYGSWIDAGETTFTEGFYVKDKTNAPASHNHQMFSDVLSWYIRHILGININPHRESIEELLIKPDVIPQLQFAEGHVNTPKGKIYLKWEKNAKERVMLTLEVPENSYGFMIAPDGYKFSDGKCHKPLEGGRYLLYKDTEPDEASDYFID